MEFYNTVQRSRHGKNSQECHFQNLRHLPLWENAMWWCFAVGKHCTGCRGESACCLPYFACEALLRLLFIEPIQGTWAQFSSVERHIRISTSGDFSRTLKWVKCCWIPFDFVLSLVKPASVGLHLSALNVLNFCIKFFHLGWDGGSTTLQRSPWSGYWLKIRDLCLLPSITPEKCPRWPLVLPFFFFFGGIFPIISTSYNSSNQNTWKGGCLVVRWSCCCETAS